MKRTRLSAGFTLIEVMVALAILAVLSLLTAQSIQSGIASRIKFEDQIERESSIRDAIRIIESDVAAGFHHRDIFVTMMNELVAGPTPDPNAPPGSRNPTPPPISPNAGAPGTGAASPFGTPRPTPVPVTGFIGDKEKVFFTVKNHVRTARDAKESDQAKVGYYLKSCRSHDAKAEQTRCLVRSVSTKLDDKIDEPGAETVLIDHVEEFSLRYFGPGHEDFVDKWDSGESGDAASKGNFPYAVEVTLTIFNRNDPRSKKTSETILAPINFPNNPPKKKEDQKQGA